MEGPAQACSDVNGPIPQTRERRAWIALAIVAGSVFALLVLDLLLAGPLSAADAGVSLWFAHRRVPPITQILFAVTEWHSTIGVLCMAVLTGAALAWRRRWRLVALLASCVGAGMLLNVGLKLAFQRARPLSDDSLVHLATFSFPSGHAVAATVWWGFVVVLVARLQPRFRPAAMAWSMLIIPLVMLSRVYLGAHFLSDVLAGCAEGLAWLSLCMLTVGRRA